MLTIVGIIARVVIAYVGIGLLLFYVFMICNILLNRKDKSETKFILKDAFLYLIIWPLDIKEALVIYRLCKKTGLEFWKKDDEEA